MQDIKKQLDALYQLRHFLTDFGKDLATCAQMYNDVVLGLREAGVPLQLADNYDINYYSTNRKLLWLTIETLSDVDLKFIDVNIQALEQVLIGATGASNIGTLKAETFREGTENIRRKIAKENEARQKQKEALDKAIVDIKKNVPNEREARSYDSELPSDELLSQIRNNILSER